MSFTKSAETIRNLKEATDKLDSMIGKLATYNALFMFKNKECMESEDGKDFVKQLEAIDKITMDINNSIEAVSSRIDLIKQLEK